MKVERFITKQGLERYMVIDDDYVPIEIVNRFLKFKDNAGKARNTLRAYAYQLSTFFDYLAQKGLNYGEVVLEDIAAYMRWLQYPERLDKVASITKSSRGLRRVSVNAYVSTVTEFYSYLMRIEDVNAGIADKLKVQMSVGKRGYKDFLYHVNKGKTFDAKYLKLKNEIKEKRPLDELEVKTLINACRNHRDSFLLQLLYEGGLRIGECLALWLEDIDVMGRTVSVVDRGQLKNNAEIKTVSSERTINVSEGLINAFLDYVAECHDDKVETNFVFFKLTGNEAGEPLDYACVDALFRKLRKRTGIYVTPHSFRHTHFDRLRREGWGFEKIQKRGGWANVQTPMKIYSHPSDDEIRESWEKVEEKFGMEEGGECLQEQ